MLSTSMDFELADSRSTEMLGAAMARWDAESAYWLTTWERVRQLLSERKQDEPFPSIDVLRAKQ